MNRFHIPTDIQYGPNSLGYLSQLTGNVLIITDAFMSTSDVMKEVLAQLSDSTVAIFDRVKPNPTIDQVADGYRVFCQVHPQALIAVGGGSSIDTAKAIHHVAISQGCSDVHFVVIPTTSGSGSEMTSYAVITDPETNTKMAIISDDMYPEVAILDPEVVVSTPPGLTADTGMDAVTHAVEAYVSIRHTDFADAVAEKALHLLFEYLPITFADGHDIDARERVHNAACLAGIAFENVGLGIVHSLSHAIGGTFPAPHGRLNGIILPTVMEYNAGDLSVNSTPSRTAQRYAQLGRMLGATSASIRNQTHGFIALVRHLRHDLDMPERITELGIQPYDFVAAIPDIARTALADTCTRDNPAPVTQANLETLLQHLV